MEVRLRRADLARERCAGWAIFIDPRDKGMLVHGISLPQENFSVKRSFPTGNGLALTPLR